MTYYDPRTKNYDVNSRNTNKSNRLVHGPYLLQYTNNPLDWYPWGAEAFGKHSENRPVFLSVGYS
ncbi:DUF255 domain-containing protein [Pelosinus sp. IPA-1]|uniref:DUF255 domain-containing protein n=1 Tax=Pelosinus sp. IPA-1 TaxID=3029569 RepID=UPI0024361644|nr:DUF255 domain-containing protein [Pelosinus sp. IPA-1]GMA98250.1 hypothetical protein PIPA1_10500 [Pelosinus sp. IPA-1]